MTLRESLDSGNYLAARGEIAASLEKATTTFPQTLADLEQYLEDHPRSLPPRILMAELFIRDHQFDLAADELEESLQYAPHDPMLLAEMGGLFLRLDRPGEAVTVLTAAAEWLPLSRELWELLGQAHYAGQNIPRAIECLERADQLGSPSPEILRALADMHSRTGNIESAIQVLFRLQKEFPELLSETLLKMEELRGISIESPVVWMAAELYQKALRPEPALGLYRALVEKVPGARDRVITCLRNLLKTFPENAMAENILAEALITQGLYTEAAQIYQKLLGNGSMVDAAHEGLQKIVEQFPGQLFAIELLADSFFRQGMIREGLEQFRKLIIQNADMIPVVIKRCTELAKSTPNSPEIYQTLACAEEKRGNLAAAEEAILEAHRRNPNDPSTLETLSEIYRAQNAFEKAIRFLGQALMRMPYETSLQEKFFELRQGKILREVDVLLSQSSPEATSSNGTRQIAMLLARAGEWEQAMEYYQRAIQTTPRAPLAHWELGRVFMKMGRFDQALPPLEQAAETWEASTTEVKLDLWNDLGHCLEALGHIAPALGWYEKILSQNIHYGTLQRHTVHLSHLTFAPNAHKRLVLIPTHFRRDPFGVIVALPPDHAQKRARSSEGLSVSFGQNHNLTGCESVLRHHHGEALEQFQVALSLDPTLREAQGNLALVLILEKNWKEAQTLLHQVLESESGEPLHWLHLALLHKAQGDTEAALGYCEKAIGLDPENPYVLLSLGDLRYDSGRVEGAFTAWDAIPGNHLLSIYLEERWWRTARDVTRGR